MHVEPILSKQEIADLLSSLHHHTPSTDSDRGQSSFADSFDHDDINLFHLYAGPGEPDTIPNFDLIMDLFGEYFTAALSQSLQCNIKITETSVTYQRFNTYLISEPNPGAIGVIKAAPLNYGGLITFSPHLVFTLIEMLLGGSPKPDSLQPDRTATKIELAILESLLTHGCKAFQQAIIPVVQIKAELVKTTHDRRLVSLVNPDAELVVSTFQIQSEHFSESMQLVFPTQTFLPFKESFENLLAIEDFDAHSWLDPVSASLESMACTVMAQVDVIDMTIRDLIALKTGDLLPMNWNPKGSLDLLVEGKKKFSGIQILRDRKRHIRISDISA